MQISFCYWTKSKKLKILNKILDFVSFFYMRWTLYNFDVRVK